MQTMQENKSLLYRGAVGAAWLLGLAGLYLLLLCVAFYSTTLLTSLLFFFAGPLATLICVALLLWCAYSLRNAWLHKQASFSRFITLLGLSLACLILSVIGLALLLQSVTVSLLFIAGPAIALILSVAALAMAFLYWHAGKRASESATPLPKTVVVKRFWKVLPTLKVMKQSVSFSKKTAAADQDPLLSAPPQVEAVAAAAAAAELVTITVDDVPDSSSVLANSFQTPPRHQGTPVGSRDRGSVQSPLVNGRSPLEAALGASFSPVKASSLLSPSQTFSSPGVQASPATVAKWCCRQHAAVIKSLIDYVSDDKSKLSLIPTLSGETTTSPAKDAKGAARLGALADRLGELKQQGSPGTDGT